MSKDQELGCYMCLDSNLSLSGATWQYLTAAIPTWQSLTYRLARKYFLQALGHEGLNNLLAAYEDKTAFAVCTFAYSAGPGHEPLIFQGRTQGKIVPARGPGVFGMNLCICCA